MHTPSQCFFLPRVQNFMIISLTCSAGLLTDFESLEVIVIASTSAIDENLTATASCNEMVPPHASPTWSSVRLQRAEFRSLGGRRWGSCGAFCDTLSRGTVKECSTRTLATNDTLERAEELTWLPTHGGTRCATCRVDLTRDLTHCV